MARPRDYRPLQEVGDPELLSHVRELKRARQEVADLRHRLETVERVLRAVSVLVRPYDADRQHSNEPVRPHTRVSKSGEPQYD
jgi:hypothetical protein